MSKNLSDGEADLDITDDFSEHGPDSAIKHCEVEIEMSSPGPNIKSSQSSKKNYHE